MTNPTRRFRPDTADRIRPCTYIRHDGKARMVERVALAPTVARPGRIRLFLTDLSGRLDQAGEAIHLDAGETIDQTWDPRCPRPTAADLAQTDPADQAIHGLRIGATVHITGRGGTYRIEDVSRAANEVQVDGYWVSADLAEAARDEARPAPATATRTAPSTYVVSAPHIDRGLRFTSHGETFEVVGEPIPGGWKSYTVRVRQVGGRYDGNEFSAYLLAR